MCGKPAAVAGVMSFSSPNPGDPLKPPVATSAVGHKKWIQRTLRRGCAARPELPSDTGLILIFNTVRSPGKITSLVHTYSWGGGERGGQGGHCKPGAVLRTRGRSRGAHTGWTGESGAGTVALEPGAVGWCWRPRTGVLRVVMAVRGGTGVSLGTAAPPFSPISVGASSCGPAARPHAPIAALLGAFCCRPHGGPHTPPCPSLRPLRAAPQPAHLSLQARDPRGTPHLAGHPVQRHEWAVGWEGWGHLGGAGGLPDWGVGSPQPTPGCTGLAGSGTRASPVLWGR